MNIYELNHQLLEACKEAKDRLTELANLNDNCWLDWPGAYEIDRAIAAAEGGEGHEGLE